MASKMINGEDIRLNVRPRTKIRLRRGSRPAVIPVGITGVGSAIPEKKLTNYDLEQMVDTSDEWIQTRTGIKERRIVAGDETTSTLAVKAAEKALATAGVTGEDIDLIVVATATPDMMFPATACLVQREIGASRAAAFDLAAGCSGFVYALAVGSQFLQTGRYQRALVIGSETLSKITNWQDRDTCVLFGDGAGAAVLEQTEPGYGFLSVHLGADGWGGDCLTQPAGGSAMPATVETVNNNLHCIKMEGREVFKFAVKVMAQASMVALRQAGLKKSELDFLIPHQANIRIIEAAKARLELDDEQVLVNIERFGNTSSASIPIALDEALSASRISRGDHVLMVAFGAGLTWASALVKWCGEKSQ